MTLASGRTLSFYEILGPLGAGGMGEVYRARDTRLDRLVAIKVLPAELSADDDRLRRFEREAKVLASLNHPNVAGIYGVDRDGDVSFLSLELVPGEDLAARVSRGALPVEDALDVCRQIAEGVEAAHEAGVVHRDLKPANVRITPSGEVKVLDFGLAKPITAEDPAGSTDSVLSTEVGRVLGTPTYMAPEQARGRAIDRRVDVWALGCVLYECLTGKRAFDGETLSDVLAGVLEREPDWSALPDRTPPRVRDLIARCLVKDPRQRLRDAGDARLELERAIQGREWSRPSTESARDRGLRPGSVLRVVVLGLAVVIGAALLRDALTEDRLVPRRLSLSLQVHGLVQRVYPRISADGLTVVHEGELPARDGRPAVRALFRRELDDFESVALAGTENPLTFCFSPNGEHLAVVVEQTGRGGDLAVVQVAVRGSAPTVRLGPWPRTYRASGGIAWIASDQLVGTTEHDQLVVLPAQGGESPTLRPIERTLEGSRPGIDVYRGLPDGRHVFGRTYFYDERGYVSALVTIDVETGREKLAVRNAGHGALTPGGTLLFTRGDALFEAPFDPESLEPSGPAVPLADGLGTEEAWRSAWFDVARDGTLIWLPGGMAGARRHLAILERTGELTPLLAERMAHDGQVLTSDDGSYFTTMVLSADGNRVEAWGSELEDPRLRRLLAAPGTDFMNAHPLPGGREMIYLRVSDAGQNGIYRAPIADPARAELLVASDPSRGSVEPVDVSPDGELLLLDRTDEDGIHYSTVALVGEEPRAEEPLFSVARADHWPKFSPDGRWLVYSTEEVDRSRIVARRFAAGTADGPALPVPTPDGIPPFDVVWSKNPDSGGLEVILVDDDRRRIFAVPLVEAEPARFGEPRLIGTLDDGYVADNAPLPDGRLLLLVMDPEDLEVGRVEVVIGALGGEARKR